MLTARIDTAAVRVRPAVAPKVPHPIRLFAAKDTNDSSTDDQRTAPRQNAEGLHTCRTFQSQSIRFTPPQPDRGARSCSSLTRLQLQRATESRRSRLGPGVYSMPSDGSKRTRFASSCQAWRRQCKDALAPQGSCPGPGLRRQHPRRLGVHERRCWSLGADLLCSLRCSTVLGHGPKCYSGLGPAAALLSQTTFASRPQPDSWLGVLPY